MLAKQVGVCLEQQFPKTVLNIWGGCFFSHSLQDARGNDGRTAADLGWHNNKAIGGRPTPEKIAQTCGFLVV